MRGHPTGVALRQEERRAAGAAEGLTVGVLASGVPGNDDAQGFAGTEAVELVQPEGEVADGWPHVAPLLALERLATCNDRGECSKCDHVVGEQRACSLVIDGSNARLHLDEKLARAGVEAWRRHQRMRGYQSRRLPARYRWRYLRGTSVEAFIHSLPRPAPTKLHGCCPPGRLT
jgi:hypothetical protein